MRKVKSAMKEPRPAGDGTALFSDVAKLDLASTQKPAKKARRGALASKAAAPEGDDDVQCISSGGSGSEGSSSS